jgi:hypothetical protein
MMRELHGRGTMPAISNNASPWIFRYLVVALIAGVAAAVIEMVFVLPIQALLLGNPPVRIFLVIAAGFLGGAALKGGAEVVILGTAIHVFVSVVAAVVYVFAARLWDDVLVRKPVISGLAFGAVCYVVMTLIVIPLSAIGYRPNPSIVNIWLSIAIHVFAFGLPIGLVSSWALFGRQETEFADVAVNVPLRPRWGPREG